MNYEEQIQALASMVEDKYLKKDPHVRGGPFTSGDYVRWKLNQIFGPDYWSSTIIKGPDLITLNDNNAYAETVVRLAVEFANGKISTHDDIGIWPLVATKNNGVSVGLDATAPERYETVIKATITDGLKACVEYLGLCFRPLGDKELEGIIKNAENFKKMEEKFPDNGHASKESVSPPPMTYTNGNGQNENVSSNERANADAFPTPPPASTTHSSSSKSDTPKQQPVNSTAYYIAATGSKFGFDHRSAAEIARLVVGNPTKQTDFSPALASLEYFKECRLNGLDLMPAAENLRRCNMDIDKAISSINIGAA